MRILYLNLDPGVPVSGPKGASVHVRAMAGALAGRGHEVVVIGVRAHPSGGSERFDVCTPPASASRPRAGSATGEQQAMRLDHDHLEFILAHARSRPVDLIYERHALWSRAGVDAAGALRIPHVLEVNAPLVEESSRYRTLHDVRQAIESTEYVFQRTSVLLAVSTPIADHVRHHGAPADRVRVMPNAVMAGDIARDIPERAGNHFVIGFCGGLRPWHGVEDLLAIFIAVHASAPESRLLVVGDGPGRATLEDGLDRSGLSGAATLTGAVGHEDVHRWLALMDVGLAPYPRIEPFYFSPLKIFEYQAAGLPVVTSRQGDLPAYVRHGETGFLYEPGDVAEAAARVLGLRRDRALARRMGALGRARVRQEHTWEQRAADVETLVRAMSPASGGRAMTGAGGRP